MDKKVYLVWIHIGSGIFIVGDDKIHLFHNFNDAVDFVKMKGEEKADLLDYHYNSVCPELGRKCRRFFEVDDEEETAVYSITGASMEDSVIIRLSKKEIE